jgi:murein DD-endopeptidase MepM/ murein hydrolase activator NlpD
MRLSRHLVALTALACCVLLVQPAVPTRAQTSSDRLQEIEEELAEKRAGIERTEDQKRSLLDDIAASDARLDEINASLGELQALLKEATARLAPVQSAFVMAVARHRGLVRRVEITRKQLAAQIEVLGSRAAASYRAGPGTWFDVVFTSSSFGDLIERQELANQVLLFDSSIVDTVEATKARLTDERNQAAAAKAEIKVRRDDLRAQVRRVRRLVEEQVAAQAALEQEIAVRQGALRDVEAAQAAYEAAVADLQAESDRIRGVIQGGGSSGSGSSSGVFYWPTAGSITSGFGWRVHPIFGTRRFHAGVDIGGACGQPIYAANTGTVLSVYMSDGYGLFTIVDHGNGLATAYAHQSGTNVAPGQHVGRGQHIGSVGQTGWATGCHLHFEVRVNGTPVDPVPYLT